MFRNIFNGLMFEEIQILVFNGFFICCLELKPFDGNEQLLGKEHFNIFENVFAE